MLPTGAPSPEERRFGVIHQPYFLPWLGYFAKLAFCDAFVVLDNVAFVKQHYLDRTRLISMHGELIWLSLPAGQNLGVPIRDVVLRPPDSRSLAKLGRTVRSSYARARHFSEEWPHLERALDEGFSGEPISLLSLNLALIRKVMGRLGIDEPTFVFASGLSDAVDPTTRVVETCLRSGISDLVVGPGQSRAVHDLQAIRRAGIRIHLQDYLSAHPEYGQLRRRELGFVKGLSVVDALMNCGASAVRALVASPEHAPKALADD